MKVGSFEIKLPTFQNIDGKVAGRCLSVSSNGYFLGEVYLMPKDVSNLVAVLTNGPRSHTIENASSPYKMVAESDGRGLYTIKDGSSAPKWAIHLPWEESTLLTNALRSISIEYFN